MGVPPSLALASIRFSLGHDTTVAEIDEAVARIAALLPEVRRR
jgi:cysteine sulfinate desulfinase/cysteine desulfurase-like protein